MANVAHDPWSALQLALDEHSEGRKFACPNPNCGAVYGITDEEMRRDCDSECGRCGWGPMVECVCKGCGKRVSNVDIGYVDRDEEHVWCDKCAEKNGIRHIAGICEVWRR